MLSVMMFHFPSDNGSTCDYALAVKPPFPVTTTPSSPNDSLGPSRLKNALVLWLTAFVFHPILRSTPFFTLRSSELTMDPSPLSQTLGPSELSLRNRYDDHYAS